MHVNIALPIIQDLTLQYRQSKHSIIQRIIIALLLLYNIVIITYFSTILASKIHNDPKKKKFQAKSKKLTKNNLLFRLVSKAMGTLRETNQNTPNFV